jgi:hypothetical protein
VSNRRFGWIIGAIFLVLFFLGLFLLGFFAGYWLSSIPGLRTYKLLNIVGILYALLGVSVLSEIFATSRWKGFCVQWLAPAILWIHTISLLGAFLCGFVAAKILHKSSGLAVAHFSLSFWVNFIFIGMAFDAIVVNPQLPFLKRDVETRWRWLGFLLVVDGLGAQLIAAVMDIMR